MKKNQKKELTADTKDRTMKIRDNILNFSIVIVMVLLVCTTLEKAIGISSFVTRYSQQVVLEQAEGNAQTIEQWLQHQSGLIHSMVLAISEMSSNDGTGSLPAQRIMDYLEKNLEANDKALMYYCCLGYNGGMMPADHSKVDLDPTTREWWQQAVKEQRLIYTDPYVDVVTGQMVMSIAEPFLLEGEQAVFLADIPIDSLIQKIEELGNEEGRESFLLTADHRVITHPNLNLLPEGNEEIFYSEVARLDLSEEGTGIFTDQDGVENIFAVYLLIDLKIKITPYWNGKAYPRRCYFFYFSTCFFSLFPQLFYTTAYPAFRRILRSVLLPVLLDCPLSGLRLPL